MTGVYIHISSNDSKKLYAGNRLDDFVVEFDAEISPCHSSGNMRAGGGGGGELAVAVTELSIVGAKPFARRWLNLAFCFVTFVILHISAVSLHQFCVYFLLLMS